ADSVRVDRARRALGRHADGRWRDAQDCWQCAGGCRACAYTRCTSPMPMRTSARRLGTRGVRSKAAGTFADGRAHCTGTLRMRRRRLLRCAGDLRRAGAAGTSRASLADAAGRWRRAWLLRDGVQRLAPSAAADHRRKSPPLPKVAQAQPIATASYRSQLRPARPRQRRLLARPPRPCCPSLIASSHRSSPLRARHSSRDQETCSARPRSPRRARP
ncbi:Unknown protein, partial [Striga hermonthica]